MMRMERFEFLKFTDMYYFQKITGLVKKMKILCDNQAKFTLEGR